MPGPFVRFLLLPLALTAAALSVGTARADMIITPVDFCPLAPADHTVNSAFPHFYASSDTSYANTACGRYILDVYAFPGTGTLTLDGYPESLGELGMPACFGLTAHLTVYSRGLLAAAFTRIKSATFKGVWSDDPPGPAPPGCSLAQTSGDPSSQFEFGLVPGLYGGKTYRLAAAAKTTILGQTTTLPVTVGMSCTSPIAPICLP